MRHGAKGFEGFQVEGDFDELEAIWFGGQKPPPPRSFFAYLLLGGGESKMWLTLPLFIQLFLTSKRLKKRRRANEDEEGETHTHK